MEFSKVTMILRGYNYEQAKNVAEVLLHAKYARNMEITLNTDNAFEIIEKISREYGHKLNIGAGTVQTFDELIRAIDVGAKFVLSPCSMSKCMIDYCKERNVLCVPGAFTPSEIFNQLEQGANIIKVFPANEVSLSYAKKICEPMGDLPLMAVGGITKSNVHEALQSGYSYVGTAGGLFPKKYILSMNYKEMLSILKGFESELD